MDVVMSEIAEKLQSPQSIQSGSMQGSAVAGIEIAFGEAGPHRRVIGQVPGSEMDESRRNPLAESAIGFHE